MSLKTAILLLLTILFSACAGSLVEQKRLVIDGKEIQELPSVEISWAPELEYSLHYFLKTDPKYLLQAQKSFKNYDQEMTKIFAAYGIPQELLNVAAIESKFNPKARSSYGAVGMWQFMPATAKAYGLKVNVWKDQRKDPYLSTEAAARYLYDLYARFKDWHWALAAYNAGPTKVARVYRASRSKNFWGSTHLLPGQTKAFVSRIMASIIIERNQIEIKSYNPVTMASLVRQLRNMYA